jgi:hypothetical protein
MILMRNSIAVGVKPRLVAYTLRVLTTFSVLSILIALIATPSLAQRRPAAKRPPAAKAKPKIPQITKVVFAKDMKSVSYTFKYAREERILNFPLQPKGDYHVTVHKPGVTKPLIDLLVSSNKATATTADGTFVLQKGKKVLPAKTDKFAIWILMQDMAKNSSLTPQSFYDAAFAIVVKEATTDRKPTPQSSPYGPKYESWSNYFRNMFQDCQGYTATCTERTTEGSNTITVSCDCGRPACQTVTSTVTIQTAAWNPAQNEFEVVEMTETVSKCVCSCVEFLTISEDGIELGRP